MKHKLLISGLGGMILLFGALLCAGCDLFAPEEQDSARGDDGPISQLPGLSAPADVEAVTLSSSSIEVSWTEVPDAVSYRVYRSDSSYSYSAYTLVAENLTTPPYIDTGLSLNTTYYYKVSAVYDTGDSSAQSDYASASTTGLKAPAGVTATALSSSSIRISWSEVSGAATYKVFRSNNGLEGSYTERAKDLTATSYTDTGLTLNTTYYYKVSAVNDTGNSGPQSVSVSAKTSSYSSGTDEGVYVGIISFAGDATPLTGDLVLLDAAGKTYLLEQLQSAYSISGTGGTALYYAVHTALAQLTSRGTQYPAGLDAVNVITFTDGLDNGSIGKSLQSPIEDISFNSVDEYTAYLSGEIASRTIAGKPITAYSVGVAGSDVTDRSKFASDLAKIASPSKSKTLNDFGELQETFQGIADSLEITHTDLASFTMKTTLLPGGARVRMTFDVNSQASSDADNSTKYFEGVIAITGTGANLVYTLTNISYAGLTAREGEGPITGVISGSEVNFAFTNVTGYDPSKDEANAKQWLKDSGATAWQINSEYDVSGATSTLTETRSSVIYLALDASASLKPEQINQIKSALSDFITALYNDLSNIVVKPNAPTNVKAIAHETENSITISWTAAWGATSYRVYPSPGTSTEVSATSYTDTGLIGGTTYTYTVSAVNSAGASDQSKPGVSATTILNAPTNVQAATQSSSTGIIVSWEKVSGATGYKVYRSNGGESGEYTLRTGSTPLDRTSYTDNSVSAGITYYYKVSAVNGNVNVKESVYSSAASVTTKLNAPANVTATAQSSSSIEISWDPVLGATSYRVYRSDNGQSDTYKEIAKDVTAPSYPDDKDLSAATTYYYTVSTVNDGGEGAKSSAKFATTKPNTPTGVEAAAKSTYSIEISWDVPVSHASAIYNVYGLNSESGEYDRLNNNVNVSIQGNKYLYTKTGLSAGTTYSYKISRTIGNVESDQSVAVSATTKLAAPTGVQATAQSSSSIEISWTEVTGATSYTVYRSESQSGIYTEEIAKDLTTILYTDDTGLSPEKTYYYKVSTVNNGGEGDQSGHASATTKPSAPTGVTAEAESSTSIKISWTAKSGASSYKVYRSDSVDGDYTALSSATSLTTTSHTDSYNLSVGTTYYYKVSWVNNSGVESDKSAAVSATTSDSP